MDLLFKNDKSCRLMVFGVKQESTFFILHSLMLCVCDSKTHQTHTFFFVFLRRFQVPTLCLEPSERTQFFMFGVSGYRLTRHSLTIRSIRGTIFLIMCMHGLKKFASIHVLFQNIFVRITLPSHNFDPPSLPNYGTVLWGRDIAHLFALRKIK